MGENVQCPVCTLYLHAGMNLSDHLETHPKEQVIRALVQMTISGNNNVLSAESSTGNAAKKPSADVEDKSFSSTKDNALNIGVAGNNSSSLNDSTSNSSLSNQNANNNQNLNNILNFSDKKIERHHAKEQDTMSTSSSIVPVQTVVKAETNNITAVAKNNVANDNTNQCYSKQSFNQTNSTSNSKSSANHSYHQNSIALTNVTNNIHNNFNVFGCNTRYEQQQRNGSNNQDQLPTPHMPPPPPPSSSQGPNPSQHQEVIGRGISPGGSGGTFNSVQPQQLPPPPPPHNSSSHLINSPSGQRQAHMVAVGQPQQPPTNPQHSQNLKVIYTPNLPPPPPLQLFTYQPHTHLPHHQKPPPAYGTAISQIRSQHNQSKHQVSGPLVSQHQQQTLQVHSVLQQQLQQHQTLQHSLRIQVPPPPSQPLLQNQTKHLCSPKNNDLSSQSHAATSRHNQSQQHQEQPKVNLSQHQLNQQQRLHHHQQQQKQQHKQQQHQQQQEQQQQKQGQQEKEKEQEQQEKEKEHQQQLQQQQQQQQKQQQSKSETENNSNNHIFNSNEILNKPSIRATYSATSQNSNANVASYSQVSISPSSTSTSMAAVAASALGRHTNSPFAALLAAAAGAPSPSNTSSVLRYAESPVAHYLERDNGDFIVQETPKHIVECVETDNGEFSVIERIYQSPPSVLHIHDDCDDDVEDNSNDNDDDDENDNCEDRADDKERENTDSKSVKNTTNDSVENEKTSKIDLDEKKEKTFPTKIKINKSKEKTKSDDDQSSANDETVDFVSISSDSSDEEEFISQEEKDAKNPSERNKQNLTSLTSLLPVSTTSIQSSLTSSSSLSSAPKLVTPSDDQQPPISSTLSASLHTSVNTASAQQNSGVTIANNASSRKKSSKNTITVLSDVQLNLNEYLDLVGNIIASSKVAAQRKSLESVTPIPLVKIEKEEPMDDYITNTTTSLETTTLTNFETTPPLKANKLETDEIIDSPNSSYNKQATNNHNVILINKLQQDEQEEKKPQVYTSSSSETDITSVAISNSCPNPTTTNSSHVTSVIRMVTTSQHQQQGKLKNSNEAEDLSQPQQKIQFLTNSKTLGPIQLARKGPKKLVIKPKSTKTEALRTITTASIPNQNQKSNDKEMPTTSAKALQNSFPDADVVNTAEVKVKNEPITSITYDNLQHPQYKPPTSFSILEQHLSSKEPILEFKEEKPCITESSLPSTSIIKEMKTENNVNDDARVLYDFANSKKCQKEALSTFPSPSSVFSSQQTSVQMTLVEATQNQHISKNINRENDASSSSSSIYSSQSALDVSMPPEELNENSTTNTSAVQTQHQTNHLYTDFHFNYLYNNGSNNATPVPSEQTDIKNHHQFTSFYQNSANSSNNTMLLEDSSSSKQYTDYQQLQHNHHFLQQQHQVSGTSHDQWFNNNNYQTSETNVTPITLNHSVSNVNSCLSVDGNTVALDGSEGSKYLDLDSCKREQNIDNIVGDRVTVPAPPPPSSSTSCSFNGTTDNSMAGICSTAVTLNIRTDEKMPAKGEISEQESNCDIDNSWSQPMYGDISARFFKTTFPGIFPQDNGWNHEEYFTVQDLSASTTAQATNSVNNRLKSFEATNNSSNNSNGIPIFSQNSNDNCNIDVMPSTSAKIRKRRKRGSQDGKTSQINGKRAQPTSTVTSQQMLIHQNEIPGVEFGFHHQQLHHQHNSQQNLQQPGTSTEFLAGPSTDSISGFMMQQQRPQQNQPQQKQRTKVYECGHCNAKYSKLKDRNAHMIDVHNYIRQNRRLVCPTTGLATPLNQTDMQDNIIPTTSAAGNILMPVSENVDYMGDYKQGIVKIENENPQRDSSAIDAINANLSAKTEITEDDKQSLSLTMNPSNIETIHGYDTKIQTNSLPLSLTTPTSKLTTLYRMLVSFNMTILKQNQNLSDFDESLIKSSIFFCYICRQNFNSVKLYDAHLTEHPAECFTCGKKFQRWKNFSLHLKRHLGWKEFGCTVCDKKFVVRSALVEHTRMHSGLSPLKCKVCGKHFKRYSNLTQHRKRHTKHIVRRKEYVCYCGEVLPSKARFLWHKETHDSKPKCCPHCCDRFVHVNSLRRHIRLAHSDKFDYTEPMECPICKQIFAKASMKAHMATHSTDTQYDCAICNKSFSTKWNLKIHSWVHANRTAKPFKCEHCPKAFVREVDFKNHMNSHKQIKPYTCEVCGCKFIRKYNYMRHRREHHGNKKYTCDLCKKSFHRHYYLIEHRRIHTGERPFQCSICGKSSTTKTNHNKHLKIHHSRDPFTVEV